MNVLVIGAGVAAVTAAHHLLEHGHAPVLMTGHAEFGFPHGGCGLWNTTLLPWPLDTREEAVGSGDETVTMRSQWLVKRLVHRYTEAGGTSTCRARVILDPRLHLVGTGAIELPSIDRILLADQDVPEPTVHEGEATPLLQPSRVVRWFGGVLPPHHVEPTTMDMWGRRGDGTIECWSKDAAAFEPYREQMIEQLHVDWDEAMPPRADIVALQAMEAVEAFLS